MQSHELQAVKRQNRGTARATYLHAKLGKHTCDYLLDADREVTIIPATDVAGEVMKPSSHKLTTANGTEKHSGTVSGLVSENE